MSKLFILFLVIIPIQTAFCQNYLRGKVLDKENQPIRDAVVTINEVSKRTDDSGIFLFPYHTITDVKQHQFHVVVTKEGYESFEQSIPTQSIGSSQRLTQSIKLLARIDTLSVAPTFHNLFPASSKSPYAGIGIMGSENDFSYTFHKDLLRKLPSKYQEHTLAKKWVSPEGGQQIFDLSYQGRLTRSHFPDQLSDISLLFLGKRFVSIRPSNLRSGEIAEIDIEVICVDLRNGEVIDTYYKNAEKWGHRGGGAEANAMELIWPSLITFIVNNLN